MNRKFETLAVLAGGLLLAGSADAALIGSWGFDGDYSNAVAGGSAIDAGNDAANNPGVFINTTIGGEAATVLDYAAAAAGSYFQVANDAGANGGGTHTNNYTLVMDIMIDDLTAGSGYVSLLEQTRIGTDVNWFIRSSGGMDISYDGQTVTTDITSGTWHRLVLTRTSGELFRGYVDGVLVSDATWAAYGADDGDFRLNVGGVFYPFSDESGDTNDIQINNLAYFDETLSDAQVAALGGATAQAISGVPVPEPGSLALLAMGGLLIARRRRG